MCSKTLRGSQSWEEAEHPRRPLIFRTLNLRISEIETDEIALIFGSLENYLLSLSQQKTATASNFFRYKLFYWIFFKAFIPTTKEFHFSYCFSSRLSINIRQDLAASQR